MNKKKLPPLGRALDWATSEIRGRSAVAILRYWYFGEFQNAWPYDYADANRCIEFLRAVPEAIPRFKMLCEISPSWQQWKDYILERL